MNLPEFESIFKFFVMFGGFMAIIIAAGFGFKRLGKKAPAETGEARPADLDKVHELEVRLAELEERLDFAERALVDVRARAQLPPKGG